MYIKEPLAVGSSVGSGRLLGSLLGSARAVAGGFFQSFGWPQGVIGSVFFRSGFVLSVRFTRSSWRGLESLVFVPGPGSGLFFNRLVRPARRLAPCSGPSSIGARQGLAFF